MFIKKMYVILLCLKKNKCLFDKHILRTIVHYAGPYRLSTYVIQHGIEREKRDEPQKYQDKAFMFIFDYLQFCHLDEDQIKEGLVSLENSLLAGADPNYVFGKNEVLALRKKKHSPYLNSAKQKGFIFPSGSNSYATVASLATTSYPLVLKNFSLWLELMEMFFSYQAFFGSPLKIRNRNTTLILAVIYTINRHLKKFNRRKNPKIYQQQKNHCEKWLNSVFSTNRFLGLLEEKRIDLNEKKGSCSSFYYDLYKMLRVHKLNSFENMVAAFKQSSLKVKNDFMEKCCHERYYDSSFPTLKDIKENHHILSRFGLHLSHYPRLVEELLLCMKKPYTKPDELAEIIGCYSNLELSMGFMKTVVSSSKREVSASVVARLSIYFILSEIKTSHVYQDKSRVIMGIVGKIGQSMCRRDGIIDINEIFNRLLSFIVSDFPSSDEIDFTLTKAFQVAQVIIQVLDEPIKLIQYGPTVFIKDSSALEQTKRVAEEYGVRIKYESFMPNSASLDLGDSIFEEPDNKRFCPGLSY